MSQLNSNFGETMFPIASPQQGGLTTPLPGIATPALNTPVTQPENVKVAWRGEGFVQATDNAAPCQLDSPFNGGDPFGFGGMDQGSGGGGATNGALDSPFAGSVMWPKP